MIEALAYGALAASSLVLGALLGLARVWGKRPVGLVLAFGAGALISAVSFELAEEGIAVGGPAAVGLGLGAGAITYYAANALLARRSRASGQGGAGPALALGAFLDGIPEQLVLGIGIAAGNGVSLALLVAIFVSNLPEAIGSASEMRDAGARPSTVRRLWLLVALVCVAATLAGFGLAEAVGDDLNAAIDGFAAGALLVMLTDEMIPEARRTAGATAGLVTALGFALAAGLSVAG